MERNITAKRVALANLWLALGVNTELARSILKRARAREKQSFREQLAAHAALGPLLNGCGPVRVPTII